MKNRMKPNGNKENTSFNLKNEKAQRNQIFSHNTIMKIKKQVKGITLIALVVTIIVLLILAGVALNLTIGENGIFSRAQDAVNTWKNAETNEQLAMQEFSDMIDEILNGPKPEEGTLAAMYVQAVEDGCTNADGTCDNPNHLHIGDYVDFRSLTEKINQKNIQVVSSDTGYEETQTYTVNSTTNQLNWQVLGYDAEKMQVKLIAATPLKADGNDGYLVMGNAESYVKGIKRLDTICSDIYGEIEGVAEARSVKIEDINGLLEVEESEIRDINLDPVLNQCRNYGDSISDIVGWTPESYLNLLKKYGVNGTYELDTLYDTDSSNPVFSAIDEGEGTANLSGTVTGYWYTVNGEAEEGAPYVNTNEKTYQLIFNDTDYGTGGAFWLSSPGVGAYSDLADFGPGAVSIVGGLGDVGCGDDTFGSDGNDGGGGFGVRPVVSLESGVQASDVPKIADQKNPPWGGSGGGEN